MKSGAEAVHRKSKRTFRMLSIVSRHGPQVDRNPRGSLQLKQEPLVRRDCGPRGDVCRSPTMGAQIRITGIATLPKPRLQGRKTWPDGTLPLGSAPRTGSTEPVPNVGAPRTPLTKSKPGKRPETNHTPRRQFRPPINYLSSLLSGQSTQVST
jgi:hypothetical protein